MPRQARQIHPQLVCVLCDNSSSMAGEKASAATQGVRELVMECQSRGPPGRELSYFKLLLVRFDSGAAIDPLADLTPVREIDPDQIEIRGDGRQTNITAALQLTLDRLRTYLESLKEHQKREDHPLPLVILFSDGAHNVGPSPVPIAEEIKQLALDGDPVVIATAGVSVGSDQPDENTLRAIASPECYVHISAASVLSNFISSVGSSGASRSREIADKIKALGE